MRKVALAIVSGVVLLIGSVAGFIIVPEHRPGTAQTDPSCLGSVFSPCRTTSYGLSQTVYDGLRIATWALLIIGAVLVVVGLIRYASRASR